MDQKVQPIDPKLQETYNRVMNTQLPTQTLQATTPLPTLTPVGPSKSKISGSGIITKKPAVSPVVLVVAAVIFFLVYSLFWMKFFNMPIPYLP